MPSPLLKVLCVSLFLFPYFHCTHSKSPCVSLSSQLPYLPSLPPNCLVHKCCLFCFHCRMIRDIVWITPCNTFSILCDSDLVTVLSYWAMMDVSFTCKVSGLDDLSIWLFFMFWLHKTRTLIRSIFFQDIHEHFEPWTIFRNTFSWTMKQSYETVNHFSRHEFCKYLKII
jgi:hypothetical protein